MTPNWIVMLISIVVVIVLLYLAVRLITGEDDFDLGMFFRYLLTAIIAVVVLPILAMIGDALSIPEIAPIIMFIALVYAVKYIILAEVGGTEEWQEAIWITFICLVFIILFTKMMEYMSEIEILGM